ncbi:MAG: DASH family cryptochrome [Spirochaetaceae bacterium]|nr:MAG: DASH family cryptochrome [Spirochaetaceae bacterium]
MLRLARRGSHCRRHYRRHSREASVTAVDRHLIWFRNDLRTHDHPALAAVSGAESLLCVAILPPRLLGTTEHGFRRTGPFRARFLIETLQELDRELRARGNRLFVVRGQPSDVVPELCSRYDLTDIWYPDEPGTEEATEVSELTDALHRLSESTGRSVRMHAHVSSTLLHSDDLPFQLEQMPRVFTDFRKAVEHVWTVREMVNTPSGLPPPPGDPDRDNGVGPVTRDSVVGESVSVVWGIPSVEALTRESAPEPDPRAAFVWRGGEGAAKRRLEKWIWEQDALRRYKETRNGLLGAEYSSKLSAWLSVGSISPRFVYEEVRRYERERVRNHSTYWLIFELLWRDYFWFLAKKVGPRLFARSGPRRVTKPWRYDREAFDRWRTGNTGNDFIDANMREIAATGYMSNRGRQNVASFLARDLQLDWRLGAEYFESMLVDYDVASNYGNWTYAVGVGTDPREDRWFNPDRQAERYDPDGSYRRTWLAELR